MIDLLQQLLLTPKQRLEHLLQFCGLEYGALTAQQISRAGWRDAAPAAAVASIGAVVYAAISAATWLPWALIGHYLDELGQGLAPACGRPVFGWERYPLRKMAALQRKLFVLQMQFLIFVVAGALATGAGLALVPAEWCWAARAVAALDALLLAQAGALIWMWR